MNNLLRSVGHELSEGLSDTELHLLLAAVKDVRAHDPKSHEQFYDELEGLLIELRTVTLDNRDAEVFLKPVSRAEVPDYFDVIQNPMDLSTMLKKVKQKSYKSKRDFADDLNLIWDNCFKYNVGVDHPLRLAASRLRSKANLILDRITDRSDRQAPRIPPSYVSSLPSPPSSNASNDSAVKPYMNGKIKVNGRSTSKGKDKEHSQPPKIPLKITIKSHVHRPHRIPKSAITVPAVPFGDRAAIVRTPQAMSLFLELDKELDSLLGVGSSTSASTLPSTESHSIVLNFDAPAPSRKKLTVTEKMNELILSEREHSSSWGVATILANGHRGDDDSADEDMEMVADNSMVNGRHMSPAKRKRSVSSVAEGDASQRKKMKLEPQETELPPNGAGPPTAPLTAGLDSAVSEDLRSAYNPVEDPVEAALEAWWKVVQCNTLAGGGMPGTPLPPPAEPMPNRIPRKGKGTGKRKRKKEDVAQGKLKATKKINRQKDHQNPDHEDKSLLSLMNTNIRTLRKLRTVHQSYSQVTRDQEQRETGDIEGAPSGLAPPSFLEAPPIEKELILPVEPEDSARIRSRERPWRPSAVIGSEEADECVRWSCSKVLEHTTFQGTSSMALDVLTSLAVDYISNLGRTLRLYCDRHSKTMTAEDIILHTLFENGIPEISELEYYIKDDIVRHGARMLDVEKKLSNALADANAMDVIDDDVVFGEDADEDNFSSGLFGDLIGEDYLGLGAAGILAETGMANFQIPKRLWKGKKKDDAVSAAGDAKAEPALPYPIPKPFVPLTWGTVDNQIGLLQKFYKDRFEASNVPQSSLPTDPNTSLGGIPAMSISPPTPAPPYLLTLPHMPPPPPSFQPYMNGVNGIPPFPIQPAPTSQGLFLSVPSTGMPPNGVPSLSPSQSLPQSPLTAGTSPISPALPLLPPPPPPLSPSTELKDDVPDPLRTKIGPLGQVLSTNPASSTVKKKSKKEDPVKKGGGKKGEAEDASNAAGTSRADSQPSTAPKKKKSTGAANGTATKKAVKPKMPSQAPEFTILEMVPPV
ncbi:hypothetical protein SISSUDRAFT_1027315 [Sistotremastrum suecicum HHB10207 ss-3]|uniref:Bromo domain-containing protein n=1 Tax=Sistotremastrum suecicum HHB10207 ss-3 TaxID=1314776 RepID=A0A165Z034_9AGAM|nr:hypothetical protein SISSUDRAFT_1027315 [Sistotremastrum suecicum HHB10207 ss-3]